MAQKRRYGLVLAFCAFPFSAMADTIIPLAAHRVVYTLSLDHGGGAKAPAQARGKIAFDFSGTPCEGYVQNFRQITELTPSEGETRLSDMLSATFESGDSKDFRYKIETKIDRASTDDIDGKAQKTADSGIAIDLGKPKAEKLARPGPVYFPTEHLRRLIETARAGESLVEARLFDGSGDGHKVFDTLAVIGKAAAAPASEKAAQIDALKALRRWPVTISYFEPGMRDAPPSYTLSFDLYENGVSRALRLDYGDFALKGEMVELTMLPIA